VHQAWTTHTEGGSQVHHGLMVSVSRELTGVQPGAVVNGSKPAKIVLFLQEQATVSHDKTAKQQENYMVD
jgi:hypothetical protein